MANQDQLLALALAVVGGTSMGIYPAFIKTPAVLAVEVHPVIFQCYKSTMVFLTGWLFLIPRYYSLEHSSHPHAQLYQFSLWGVLSAVFWVPSGISTIFAVPRIGMGMTTAISSATSTFLSFMVFWLVFGSKMKEYPCGHDCVYYRAPIYLVATVVGMFAMIFAKQLAFRLGVAPDPGLEDEPAANDGVEKLLQGGGGSAKINDTTVVETPAQKAQTWALGLIVAVSSGTFGALQYAVVNLGKHHEQSQHGCRDDPTTCPAQLQEQFNTFGSWMVSFGLGAIGMAGCMLTLVSVRPISDPTTGACAMAGRPSFHFRVLGPPGCAGVLAGSFWAVGNFLITTAVELGGNAVIMAQSLSATIITSGLLGIFYYAIWTLVAMILLGLEKQQDAATPAGSGSGVVSSELEEWTP